MTHILLRLWKDERGSANALAIILITTIVCLGTIVGLVSLRDAIVQELGDMAVAIESLDQSFTGFNSTFVDTSSGLEDLAGSAPACISLCDCDTATGEGS